MAEIKGTGQFQAQSISIQVSDRCVCNAKCKFCISRITPGNERHSGPVKTCNMRRLSTGLDFAQRVGATHAILTGKADPMQEDGEHLCKLVRAARKHVPLIDMHTNGLLLEKNDILEDLALAGLSMVTFSIASFDETINRELMGVPQKPADIIRLAKGLELLVRCSLVVNKIGAHDFESVMDYIYAAGNLGVNMVVVREVWVPEEQGEVNRSVRDWCVENVVPIRPIEEEFVRVASDRGNKYGLEQRDPLPWGTPVFVIGRGKFKNDHGINVTFARCDEASSGPIIKSIVHKPDGHGYRNWDHGGDILY